MSIYLGISTGGKLSEKKSFANLCSQCTRDSVAAVVCEPESRSACGQVGMDEVKTMTILEKYVPSFSFLVGFCPMLDYPGCNCLLGVLLQGYPDS